MGVTSVGSLMAPSLSLRPPQLIDPCGGFNLDGSGVSSPSMTPFGERPAVETPGRRSPPLHFYLLLVMGRRGYLPTLIE